MDIITRIQSKLSKLSKSEKKVANYVLKDIGKIETNTISKVAIESGTSSSAVLRFCKSIGFEGYKEFRYEAIQYYRDSYKKNNKLDDFTSDYITAYKKALDLMIDCDSKTIDSLIKSLLSANSIFIAGIYQSGLPAQYMSNALQDLGINSRAESDINKIAHMANLISKNDVIIYFSVSGDKSNYSQSLSELTHDMPEKSFLITSNETSPLINIFNDSIILPGNIVSKQSILDPQAIPMIFIEIILNQLHGRLLSHSTRDITL